MPFRIFKRKRFSQFFLMCEIKLFLKSLDDVNFVIVDDLNKLYDEYVRSSVSVCVAVIVWHPPSNHRSHLSNESINVFEITCVLSELLQEVNISIINIPRHNTQDGKLNCVNNFKQYFTAIS